MKPRSNHGFSLYIQEGQFQSVLFCKTQIGSEEQAEPKITKRPEGETRLYTNYTPANITTNFNISLACTASSQTL